MIVLGWHGGIIREHRDAAPGWSTHDGAAVLLVDGELVCAVEEERLNRIKHSNFFPALAIRRCLDQAGIGMDAVDRIAMNFEELTRDTLPRDAGLPSIDGFLEDPARSAYSVRDVIRDLFQREFGADVSGKLFFCNHHVAHLWSAFAASGLGDSLVVSLDGSGDSLSGMAAVGGRDGLSVLRAFPVEESLGNLYSDLIRVLGYRRFDEYKAMGLAPYGDPRRFRTMFDRLYRLLPGGEFRLASRAERWSILHDCGVLPLARRAGEPFTEAHRDFAAGLQDTLETLALHVFSHYRQATGERNLCFAGGVAHNSSLNGRLLYEGLFDAVFVQPAAHDAGGALGAAVAALHAEGNGHARRPLSHVFYGRDIGTRGQVLSALQAWGAALELEPVPDPAREAARLIADGQVIGWVQGRAEFGPRALGHRSILADPRPPENGARINAMIKKRESFRPFAPSVLEEELHRVVEVPPCSADLSFMTFVLRVREPARAALGAATHIDGSARVQTVSREVDPLYWSLIHEFHQLTGVPAVLNTSFNNDAEPIVDSVDDAVGCFLTTGLDALVVGGVLVRRSAAAPAECLSPLRVMLPPSRKLVRRTRCVAAGCEEAFTIESTASRHFASTSIPISRDMYDALGRAGRPLRVGDLLSGEPGSEPLLHELLALWDRRAVWVQP